MKFLAIATVAFVAFVASTEALPKGKEFDPDCDLFHTVVSSDTCPSVCKKYNINPQSLLFEWNYGLHKTCDNMDDGTDVCVRVSGNSTGSKPPVGGKGTHHKGTKGTHHKGTKGTKKGTKGTKKGTKGTKKGTHHKKGTKGSKKGSKGTHKKGTHHKKGVKLPIVV